MNARLKAVTLVAVGVVLGGYGIYRWCVQEPRVVPFAGAVACPDHSSFDAWQGTPDSGTPIGGVTTVALAGNTTLIPEYHDCQRLIDAGEQFGPLVGIWVPPTYLGNIQDSVAAGTAIPAAVIHAWDGHYPALGIRQGWNCLYLLSAKAPSGLEGLMVQVATDSACLGSKPAASLTGYRLAVTRTVAENQGPDDYPTAGRWDRETNRRSNYIGLACGGGWCEVHSKKFAHTTSPGYSREAGATAQDRRVFAIKGWYDEQNLADASSGVFRPLRGLATLIPDPQIATLKVADYNGNWRTVATSSIETRSDAYWEKMRLGQAPLPKGSAPAGLTESALCRSGTDPETGAKFTCPDVPAGLAASCDWQTLPPDHPEFGWFVRLVSPLQPKDPLYKCATRHAHEGVEVPATARWMWLDSDETQWFRCDQGCCTLKP